MIPISLNFKMNTKTKLNTVFDTPRISRVIFKPTKLLSMHKSNKLVCGHGFRMAYILRTTLKTTLLTIANK